jgi:hypothetical protein
MVLPPQADPSGGTSVCVALSQSRPEYTPDPRCEHRRCYIQLRRAFYDDLGRTRNDPDNRLWFVEEQVPDCNRTVFQVGDVPVAVEI